MPWWLILLTAALILAQQIDCSKISTITLNTTGDAKATLSFKAYGPALPNLDLAAFFKAQRKLTIWGVDFLETGVAALAGELMRVKWDRELVYVLALYYFKPGAEWTLEKYRCVDPLTGNFLGRFYIVAEKPPREVAAVYFKVGRSETSKTEVHTIQVSYPVQRFSHKICPLYEASSGLCKICKSLDVNTGKCEEFTEENVVYLLEASQIWKAEEIENLRPGDVVFAHGVNATVPNPLYFSHATPLGDYLALTTDLGSAAFYKEIRLSVSAFPAHWGEVLLHPPKTIPLYVSRIVRADAPLSPRDFVIGAAGNATWIGDSWTWNWTIAAVASPTSFLLTPHVAVHVAGLKLASRVTIRFYVPLGSILRLSAAVIWQLRHGGGDVWIAAGPGTYLRAVDSGGRILNYEELGARGKLRYKGERHDEAPGVKWAYFSAAVDQNVGVVETAWYSPPDPCRQWPREILRCVYSQHVYTKVNGTGLSYSRVGNTGRSWPLARLPLVDWLAAKSPRRCGVEGFRDFMNIVAGDPTLNFWHTYRLRVWRFNNSTGDWDIEDICVLPPPHQVSLIGEVYNAAEYRNTTLGATPLYYSTALGAFYDYLFEGVDSPERPAGWTDAKPLGVASAPSNTSSPWLLSLIPATACNSLFCTSLDTTLWGPSPPLQPDWALPGVGYVFLLQYLGERRRASVKIYVDRGHYLDVDMKKKELEGGLLAEIDRIWEPFSGVYVGPGWHIDYSPLSPCEYKRVGPKPLYLTPDDWTGPVRVIVEEAGGKKYEFVIFVTRDIAFKIETSTYVPPLYTSQYLNITVYFYLGGLPYFHGLNALGEGGRQWRARCVEAGGHAQLVASGDFWGRLHLYADINLVDRYVEPRFEILDTSRRDLVRVISHGPVVGYAIYKMRNGVWTLHTVARGGCVLVNVSRVYPWDPVLVLPLVEQTAEVRVGGSAELWRPKPRLLYRSWPLAAGAELYTRGRPPSELELRPC